MVSVQDGVGIVVVRLVAVPGDRHEEEEGVEEIQDVLGLLLLVQGELDDLPHPDLLVALVLIEGFQIFQEVIGLPGQEEVDLRLWLEHLRLSQMAQLLIHPVLPQNRRTGDRVDRLAHKFMDGTPVLPGQQRQTLQTFRTALPALVNVLADLRDLIHLPQLLLLTWGHLQRRQNGRQMLLGGHPLAVEELKEAGTVDLGLVDDLVLGFPAQFDKLT